MSNKPQKLVVGDVSLTTGLVMNQNYESAPEGEGDQYDHMKAIPESADGLVIPSSVRGLQVLQQDMKARVPAPVLDVTVQAAFQQLVPPKLREHIHVLAEWDARWFDDLDKSSVFADIGAGYSHGDKAFEIACASTMRPCIAPWIAGDGNAALPPLARMLRSHAWTIGPVRLTGGYWAGLIIRLDGLDPTTGLYTRVAQVALVDPRRDDRLAAEGNRALRRLEHALALTGLIFGDDGDDAAVQGSYAWTRKAWRRTIWVPRQMNGGDGSCGPRYYWHAKTLFTRLGQLWEQNGGSGSGSGEPPYDEALWMTPLSGWFHPEATRWEMVGHHAARAVSDAHYQARVTAEIIRTQNGGMLPAQFAMNLPPQPTYDAPGPSSSWFAPRVFPSTAQATPRNPAMQDTSSLATASTMPATTAAAGTGAGPAVPGGTEPSLSSWFAPRVFPSAARMPPTAAAAAANAAILSQNAQTLPHLPAHPNNTAGDATNRKRRRASEAAASRPEQSHKRKCRLQIIDGPTPQPNGYPAYPLRELDPWDWRHVRWALQNPHEARLLDMHMAHYVEEMQARERGGVVGGGMGHGGRGHHGRGGNADDENGRGQNNSGPAISSSDENLDDEGKLRAHIQKSTQATGESVETFQKRYDMEVNDRAREDARARIVQQQQEQQRQQKIRDRLTNPDGTMNSNAMGLLVDKMGAIDWRR